MPPSETTHGALIHHLTATPPEHFQPSNINFGLFPPLGKKVRKRERGQVRADLAPGRFGVLAPVTGPGLQLYTLRPGSP